MHDAADLNDEPGVERFHDLGQRLVDGDQCHAQAAADKHHHRAGRLAFFGGEFGKVFGDGQDA